MGKGVREPDQETFCYENNLSEAYCFFHYYKLNIYNLIKFQQFF